MAGKISGGDIRCSFCNKTQDQVRKLIAGPAGLYICDECIEICGDILEEELKKTGNPNLINRIIIDSENNRTGSTFCDEIREKLFSPQMLQDRIARVEEIIQELEKKDEKLANECKQMLIKTTLEEKQKYKCFGYNKKLKTERGYNHNEYLNKWIEEYNKPNNIIEFRKQCLDVVLFSYMIANREGKLDDETKGLLLQAAKYHDSGRDKEFHNGRRADGKDEHAIYSKIN